jgi:hypothetical protein
MKKHVWAYFEGLLFSFVAIIFMASVGLIQTGANLNRYVDLVIVAVFFWTPVYFLCRFILALFLASLLEYSIIGIMAAAFIGFFLVKIVDYALVDEVAKFYFKDYQYFLLGLYYVVVSMYVLPDKEKFLNKLGYVKKN